MCRDRIETANQVWFQNNLEKNIFEMLMFLIPETEINNKNSQ